MKMSKFLVKHRLQELITKESSGSIGQGLETHALFNVIADLIVLSKCIKESTSSGGPTCYNTYDNISFR
jgi:hypothetical protein